MKLKHPMRNYWTLGPFAIAIYRPRDWNEWRSYSKGRWYVRHHYTNPAKREGFQMFWGEIFWGGK